MGQKRLDNSDLGKRLRAKGGRRIIKCVLNADGILILNFTDGSVKAINLEKEKPEVVLSVVRSFLPTLREALRKRREECELTLHSLRNVASELSNRFKQDVETI